MHSCRFTCSEVKQLLLNVVSTRVLRGSKSTKINSGRGFALDPTGEAYSAPPVTSSWWEGLATYFQELHYRLGPSGLAPPILTQTDANVVRLNK